MRGLIDGRWLEIEQNVEASKWIGRIQFSIKNEPEAGIFDEREFEQIGSNEIFDADEVFGTNA